MSITVEDLEAELRQRLVSLSEQRRIRQAAFYLSLAQELAMEITPPLDVLKYHGLSSEEFAEIAATPAFQTYFTEAKIAWGATSSAALRTKAKMEHMVESALPHLFQELLREGLSGPKVELLKAMMKGGGVGEQAAKGDNREGVTINIDMSAAVENKTPVITIDHNAQDM